MSPERWQQLEERFHAALDLPPESRDAFLEQHCAGDPEMLADLRRLLAGDEGPAAFLESPLQPDSLKGQHAGPWLIEDQIGSGGMGTVWRAVRDDGNYAHEAALKVILRGLDSPSLLERFRRERQFLALLNHPNIARLLDGGTTKDGRPYYVMELVEGVPITEWCDRRNLPATERLRIFLAVCAAVSHAHTNLIIHRDLKPANILVTSAGVVKLLDFGIAKFFLPDLPDPAQTRAVEGSLLTPAYAAPEQMLHQPVTTATDVYALGLVLYEMLTGSRAQDAPSGSLAEWERVICHADPPRSRQLRGDLETIVFKAVQKDPARRYATVQQLAEDIERFLDGRPVRARPDTLFYRSAKFVRRNKFGVAAAALVLFSLAAGLAGAVWQARIANAHFQSVRSLARSLLTEIHPAIEDIPGATKARHLIVRRSLDYLDRLSANAGRDATLLTEISSAYATIAAIQGNRNRSNLGDYAGAMASYRKSIELRKRIEEIAPQPRNRQWIALMSAEAARVYPTSEESLQLARSSVAIAEELSTSSPGDVENFLLPNTLFGLGYILTQREEPEAAIPIFERARKIYIEIKRTSLHYSVCDRYIAHNLLLLGQPERALFHYRRALEVDDARLKKQATPRAAMDTSYDHEGLARTLEELGRFDEALREARLTLAARERLAAADPNDQRPQTALADIREVLGSLLSRSGPRAEALRHLELALSARRGFVRASPDSPEDEYELGRALAAAAQAYRRLQQPELAARCAEEARAIFTRQNRRYSLAALGRG